MTSDVRTGIIPEVKRVRKAKRIATPSVEQTKESEKVQEKYWSCDSGKVKIDEGKLYEHLLKKSYRYFFVESDNDIYIVTVSDNTLNVYFYNKLWKLCRDLIDKDFASVSEEERVKVKAALRASKKTLKKKRLVQLLPEDLESFEDSDSKRFLMTPYKISKTEEGGAYENQ